MTAREIYGYGLIAGIAISEARKLEPGFVMDMFKLRGEYDARLQGKWQKKKAVSINDL